MCSNKLPLWIVISFLLLSLVGFADAAYLTAKHYLGEVPVCAFLEGCEEVLTSEYSTIFGVPTALLGALYYGAILFAMIAYIDLKKRALLKFIVATVSLGFIISLGLVALQAFVINAFCFYCLVSAATTTLLFVLALFSLHQFTHGGDRESIPPIV